MRESISRARLIAALGGAAAAACITGRARAAGTAIRVGALPSDVSAQAVYAQMQNFYAHGGLQADIQTLANGGAIIAAVASGALDVGFGNLTSIAAARQRGIPVKIVSPASLYTSKAPVTVLVKARGSKLRTGADLRGKTIAVSTLRGELQVGASAWIDKNGGDATQTRFLEMPFSTMAAALAVRRIDAAMITEPALTVHKAALELLSDAYSAIADEFLIGGYVVSDAWARDNADAARRFAAVMAETARWANGHRDETAAILAKRSGLDESVVRSMTRATYGEKLTADLIQPVLDAAAKYGSLKQPMKARDLIVT